METRSKNRNIHIDWRDTRQVVYKDQDNHIGVTTPSAVVEACKDHFQKKQAGEQFGELLDKLGTWVFERSDDIFKSFITVHDNALLFLIVTNSTNYNDKLQDSITDLDIEIANDPDFSTIK